MKLLTLLNLGLNVMKPMNFSDEDDRGTGRLRGSGRLATITLIVLLGFTSVAWADDRGSFPDPRCPGTSCPDNAQPKTK